MSLLRKSCAMATIVFGWAIWTLPRTAGAASLSAPLVQCASVAVPAVLSGCGSDPLTRGAASINDQGDLEIVVVGAGANQTYTAVFRSPDGTTLSSIGNLVTDASGNGTITKNTLFALGKAGAGNIVLARTVDEYVTGISVKSASPGSHAGPDFRPALIRCSDVNVPGAGSNCGTDTLKSGSVDIESDDGDLSIEISGASARSTYTAALRPVSGSALNLGSLGTDSKGKGRLDLSSAFPAGTLGTGTVALQRNGDSHDQFLSGFKVTQKPTPKTLTKSNLVRCLDVNLPPSLAGCGLDPLNHGSAQLDQNGKLEVGLSGARSKTAYEVFFRPINNSGDTDTGLALTTDQSGNAKGSRSFVKSGTTGAGTFVVKGGGFDEFLTGFAVK
jgi:hypothetical protein